jgi:hypothetical protein
MPNCLTVMPNINLKSFRLLGLLLLSPLTFFAQQLTGLWVGTFSNDSSTIRKDQSFEIALTEYRGKVYGYSRSEFIVNDTLYYIVKRVKGTINGDICEVKDDEIISYNFPGRLDKGVKVTSSFYRNKIDSTWYLAGKWKTNQTKNYYAVTGTVDLLEEKDLNASKLFPHLEELNLANDVAFYKDRKTSPPVMKVAETESKRLESFVKAERQTVMKDEATITGTKIVDVKTIPVASTQIIRTSTDPKKAEVVALPDLTDAGLVKAEVKDEPKRQKTIIKAEGQTTLKEPILSSANLKTNTVVTKTPVVSKPIVRTNSSAEIKKTTTLPVAVKTEPIVAKVEPAKEKKEQVVATITPEIKKPAIDLAAPVAGRKSIYSQIVNFKSDSLQLSLYDNGEIDGDTVTIYMNGKVLMDKQGLKATAIKKTIYLTPGKDDEFTLVMFADNLGKYPPNTGLVVIHDGDDVYNIHFSADLQTNAGVVFRRKK